MDAVLLRQGYRGSPILFKPLNLNFNLSSLSLRPYTSVYGSTIIDSKASSDFWYGPVINIPPGNYPVTFYLSSSSISSGHNPLLNLDVEFGSN